MAFTKDGIRQEKFSSKFGLCLFNITGGPEKTKRAGKSYNMYYAQFENFKLMTLQGTSISDPGSNPALDDLQIIAQLVKSSLVHM